MCLNVKSLDLLPSKYQLFVGKNPVLTHNYPLVTTTRFIKSSNIEVQATHLRTVGRLCSTYPFINLLLVTFLIFCPKYFAKLQFTSKNYSDHHWIIWWWCWCLFFTSNWDFLANLFSCTFKNLIFVFQTYFDWNFVMTYFW